MKFELWEWDLEDENWALSLRYCCSIRETKMDSEQARRVAFPGATEDCETA